MKQVFIEMEKLKNLNSGLGQFNWHLGNALAKQNKEFELNFYVPGKLQGVFGAQKYTRCSGWHRLVSPVPSGVSVWHGTHQQTKYLPSDNNVKKILTVHDLNFLYKYQGNKLDRTLQKLQRLIDKMDVLVTISAFTAEDLRLNIDLKGKTPVVIHNGNTLRVFENAQRPVWMKEEPFLFALGVLTARKNFHTLVEMMKFLPDIKLVISGNATGSYADMVRTNIAKNNLTERVVLSGEITEEEKYWLYSHCQGFVFPSLAEGFGLPVIEAMSVGKPVFISDKASLPEIGGSLAYYWKDFDAERMAHTVQKGLAECKTNTVKQQEFKLHASQFSWQRSADAYLQVYHDLVAG